MRPGAALARAIREGSSGRLGRQTGRSPPPKARTRPLGALPPFPDRAICVRSSKIRLAKKNAMASSLETVDWSTLPEPTDDGGANHLKGMSLPAISLPSTHGTMPLANLSGTTVIFIYPMTGRPDRALPDNWDMLPGARGCTPQNCAFRDLFGALRKAGATRVFGLSTQSTADQKEAADRLHLPYPLLSDAEGKFGRTLSLPAFEVDGMHLLRRLTLISRGSRIMKVFYPVFPPDRNAEDVLSWLTQNPV